MTTESLRETYETLKSWEDTQWISLALVAEIAGCTPEELAAAVTQALADEDFRAEPQPHRHRLTDEDRRHAVTIGGEPRHLICWAG